MLRRKRGRGRRTTAVAAVALSIAILGVSAQSASAELREVSPTGSDATGNLCRLYETPCATIQHAIDIAEGGDEVFVRPGVYAEDLTIDKPLELASRNGATRPAEPQAVVEGDSGTAIKAESPGITIRGMAVTTGATGTAIRVPGADADKFVVQEDIISGGSSGLRLEAGGEEDSIGYNLIAGVDNGIELGGTDYSDLRILWNQFVDPIGGYTVLAGSGTTINGLRLEGNKMPAPTRIAARVEAPSNEENWIDENSFRSANGPQLAINGDRLRFGRNTFEGQDNAGCLQILGNQGGLPPSTRVLIADDNAFIDCVPYGIELGPEVDQVGIYGNDFPGSYDGIATSNASSWDVTGRVRIQENRFVGTSNLGVDNTVAGTLDAEQNWWGCNAGPGTTGCDAVSGGVNSGDNIRLDALVGPRKPEGGIIELPTGSSITLNPGEQAEVVAMVTTDGVESNLSPPLQGAQVGFSSSLGKLSRSTAQLQNGWTKSFFTAGATPGQGSVAVRMDNQETVVPVTIRGDTGTPPTTPSQPTNPTPLPTHPETPHAPILKVTSNHNRVRGRLATVGSVSCDDSCRVAPGRAEIIIGGHRYGATMTPGGSLAASSTTPIRVALARPALRALRKFGSAQIKATVSVIDEAGQTATQTFSVKISD